MQVYVGQTSSEVLIPRLTAMEYGEVVQPTEHLPPKRTPYFYDNAAFIDWKAGRSFNEERFLTMIETSERLRLAPDFIVLPDIVAGGLSSLALSISWIGRIHSNAPKYLVAQDGMKTTDIEPHLSKVDGIFVGGSLAWKIRTAKSWIELAHKHNLPCHIGRVGTRNRVNWALRIGADSFDSCVPLFSETNLKRFKKGFDRSQVEMPILTTIDEAWPVPERKPLTITRKRPNKKQLELL